MKAKILKHYPHFEYEWMPDGSLIVRRSMVPPGFRRSFFVLWRAFMAFGPWLVAATGARFSGHYTLAMSVLVTAGGITAFIVTIITVRRLRSGPPPLTFDRTRQRLSVTGRPDVPFEDLGEVHLFERRDVVRHPPNAVILYAEKDQTVFEVYIRVDGEPLTLGESETKARALELVDKISRVMNRRV